MTTAQQDYSPFTNKRVTLKLVPESEGGENRELEGKIELGTQQGVLFKRKGSGQAEMYRSEEIVELAELAEPVKPIKAKSLKPVDVGSIKSHVLERHGATLAYANQTSAEDILTWHSSVDHAGLDLGHVHAEPKAEAAIAEASAETTGA